MTDLRSLITKLIRITETRRPIHDTELLSSIIIVAEAVETLQKQINDNYRDNVSGQVSF